MIGYTTLGTNDFDRAVAFYDELLGLLDGVSVLNDGRISVWGTDGRGMVAVCKPNDGGAASVGNGVMIALQAGDKAKVEEVYRKALSLGGTDEGEPGFRTGAFYGAYFRDLDGNKLAIYCLARQE